jgi:hypothetical protein
VDDASFCRIVNVDAGHVLVTHQKSTGNVTVTVPPGGVIYLAKSPAEPLFSNAAANCLGVSVKVF